MTQSTVAPFGSWKSPITSERIVSESIKLGQISLDGDQIYWIENRPAEGGRNGVIRLNHDGSQEVLTPQPYNTRTRVHEYGGAPYIVVNGIIYFSNFSDQRLYQHKPTHAPKPLTPAGPWFYADGIFDQSRNRLIFIREDHQVSGHEPINTIVSISLAHSQEQTQGIILVSGNDFYASPRLSPKGDQFAWLTWNHPNMPWDGTELWIADIQLSLIHI